MAGEYYQPKDQFVMTLVLDFDRRTGEAAEIVQMVADAVGHKLKRATVDGNGGPAKPASVTAHCDGYMGRWEGASRG